MVEILFKPAPFADLPTSASAVPILHHIDLPV
jgi:hypothetical protein